MIRGRPARGFLGSTWRAKAPNLTPPPLGWRTPTGAAHLSLSATTLRTAFPPNTASSVFRRRSRGAHRLGSGRAWRCAAPSRLLDAPLVYSTVSRLIIDCNRDPDAPDLDPGQLASCRTTRSPAMRPARCGAPPAHRNGPRAISSRHRRPHRAPPGGWTRDGADRHPQFHRVHRRRRAALADRPHLRPPTAALADLIAGLGRTGLNVGVNQPYSPADRVYYTLSRHAEARGLDCAMIEIRNDLVRSEQAEAEWAVRIAANFIVSG